MCQYTRYLVPYSQKHILRSIHIYLSNYLTLAGDKGRGVSGVNCDCHAEMFEELRTDAGNLIGHL